MTMRRAILVSALLALVAAPVEAQRRRSSSSGGAAARGVPSLSLEVGDGQGTFVGLWGRVADAVSLGVEAELHFVQQEEEGDGEETRVTSSRFGAGASIKWFLTARESLTPFLYAHGGVTREAVELDQAPAAVEVDATRAIVRGAVGLEWFASPRFSVGANVGARWRSGDQEVEASQLDSREETHRSVLELFTSGLSATFHF